MTRWFSKRWAWAALAGATVTVGMAAGRDGDGPPKVGAVIPLNIDGKGERQFKVIKNEKQADGSYWSELKDTKSGETMTLETKSDAPPAGPKSADPPKPAAPPKTSDPPKAKGRTTDPLTPPMSAVLDAAKAKEPEKHPVLGRIFGDKDKDKATPTPSAAKADAPADSGKKPGLLGRIFGSKKPTGPSMPATTGAPPAPVLKPGSSTPPPVLPVPPGGLSGPTAAPIPFPNTTGEPPRVMPAKPVAPRMPAIAAPAPTFLTPPPIAATAPMPPSFSPAAPPMPAAPVAPFTPAPPFPAVPAPLAMPPLPVPLPAQSVPLPIPSIPAPPAGVGLPPITVPPGGTSAVRPIQVVLPVGYVPPQVAFDREVEPFVTALQSMSAPSARLTSAKALAEGRHGSTDGVKGTLFQAAQLDPCGEVRAACITHLCNLGYFTPQFLGYVQAACNDADGQVRDAAKSACEKMFRR